MSLKKKLQTTTCNDGYIYSNYYFDETLSTKLNLVCDRKYLKTLLDTILIIGLLFGSLMGGAIGDKIGRKKACFGAIMTIVPVTICKFTKDFCKTFCFVLGLLALSL